jgi:hypothetical protein
LVQGAASQPARNRISGRAKHPQAPAPSVEAHASAAPSDIAHEVPNPAKSPSICPSIPKRPQAVPCTSCTPCAIQSRPRWPQSRLSHRAPAREHQCNQCPPPALFHTSRLRPAYPTSPRDNPQSTKPSDEQPAMHRHTIAPRSLFHTRKPPDTVRQACAMLAQRSSSDPVTFEIQCACIRSPLRTVTRSLRTGDSPFFSEEEN